MLDERAEAPFNNIKNKVRTRSTTHRWLAAVVSVAVVVVAEGRVCGRPQQERPRHRAVRRGGRRWDDHQHLGSRCARGCWKSAASRCHWAGPEPLSGLLLEESPAEEGKSACSRNITRSHRRCITAPSLRALAITRSWVWRSQRQHQPTAEAMLPATQETQTLAASAQHSKGLRPSHLSACYVGRRSEASCLMRNSAMDDSIGGS